MFFTKELEFEELEGKLEVLNKESENKSTREKLSEMLEKLKNRKKEQSEANKTLKRDGDVEGGSLTGNTRKILKWEAKRAGQPKKQHILLD